MGIINGAISGVMADDIDAELAQKIETVTDRIETLFGVLDILADGGDAMAVKTFLNKAEILGQDDLKTEDVQIPEWGGAWVRVRTLNASERDHWEAGIVNRIGKKTVFNSENIRARLCLLCLVDEEGNRLFDDGDMFPLGGKSAAALSRIYDVASRLNGLSDADVEELAGESNAAQNGALVTD
jgi:hypothetical protein